MIQRITESLAALQAEMIHVTLVCNRENLIKQWNNDLNCEWRTDELLQVSLKFLPGFALIAGKKNYNFPLQAVIDHRLISAYNP